MNSERYYTSPSYDTDTNETHPFIPSPVPSRQHTPSSSSANLLAHQYTPYHPTMDQSRRGSGTSTPRNELDHNPATFVDASSSQTHLKSGTETKVADSYEMQASSRSVSPAPGSGLNIEKEQHGSDEDDIEYPTGIKFAVISASLCLAVFLMALDNTIIATAIPKITDEFKSLDDVGWYASSYLLTTCALQLFFGKLYTFYSIKWTFLISIGIFEVGSLVCGVAPDSISLIVGRAVAGVGSAGLFCGALVIIAHTVPMSKRPAYTGIIGACYGIASIAGPLLGTLVFR